MNCLENTKKLNKTTGKCDDKHHYKTIIEELMVSKLEGCTNNSPITPNPSVSTKNISARKSLQKFSEKLDVKHRTAVCRLGTPKAKRN